MRRCRRSLPKESPDAIKRHRGWTLPPCGFDPPGEGLPAGRSRFHFVSALLRPMGKARIPRRADGKLIRVSQRQPSAQRRLCASSGWRGWRAAHTAPYRRRSVLAGRESTVTRATVSAMACEYGQSKLAFGSGPAVAVNRGMRWNGRAVRLLFLPKPFPPPCARNARRRWPRPARRGV